jgi:NADH-quinone oxidoreductase subunit L
MFETLPPLWLIPALPLAASVLIAFLGPRGLGHKSHWPCVLAVIGSCLLSFWVLGHVVQATEHHHVDRIRYYTWFEAGNVDIGFSLRADALTAIMLVTVTFVGSLIAIFAIGYMHHDPGYPRFFAEIALFIFAMTGLVLANNFIVLYAFWEGVGLCSYLLIGFWFTKPSAAAAARKAFLVTRLGDVGLFLGILLIWTTFETLDFQYVFAEVRAPAPARFPEPQTVDASLIALACALLFCGAVGKSAQFPLQVWLPDAMEGPTPVSALIHAATMVTAGVYLVARCTPLFMLAPEVQLLVACIGGFTALLAALMALTQNDLKRVLAYSTISQLGYMFLALGSGLASPTSSGLVSLAVVAAVFHLFTHAFFKALLFLAAGSVMHAMGNVIDMRRFGGLRYALPTTHWTFLCGALALAGFPLLSGFWSKDEILAATFEASHVEGNPFGLVYTLLFVSALITAGLTAFYTFRAYFLTFWGELRIPPEAGEHAHESPPVMTVPLTILAVGAVGLGIVVEPFNHAFSHLLTRTPGLGPLDHVLHLAIMIGSTVFALGGIGVALWMYVLRPGMADRFATSLQGLYQLSLNRFYLDEIFSYFIVQPLVGFAEFCRIIDLYVLDGLVDLIGQVPRFLGQVFRPIQNGLAQFYALAMALGLAVFMLALVWRYAG